MPLTCSSRLLRLVASLAVVAVAISSPATARKKGKQILQGIVGAAAIGIVIKNAAQARERSGQGQPIQIVGRRNTHDLDEIRVMAMQELLIRLGHSIGDVDGVWGPKARAAARVEQARMGHPATGWLTAAQIRYLRTGRRGAPPNPPRSGPLMEDDEVRTIRMQLALSRAGYDIGDADGRWGPAAREAARAYQASKGYRQTGRLSERELAELDPQTSNRAAPPAPAALPPSPPPPSSTQPTPPPAPEPSVVIAEPQVAPPTAAPAVAPAPSNTQPEAPRTLSLNGSKTAGSIPVTYSAPAGPCSISFPLKIVSTQVSLFANEQTLLLPLVKDIAGEAARQCANVQTIDIKGHVEKMTWYEGQLLISGDSWSLTSTMTPIRTAMSEVNYPNDELASITKIQSIVKNYEPHLGGADAVDFKALRTRAEQRYTDIADKGLTQFSEDLDKIPDQAEGLEPLEAAITASLSAINSLPETVQQRYKAVASARKERIHAAIARDVIQSYDENWSDWYGTARNITSARSAAETYRSSIPEAAQRADGFTTRALSGLDSQHAAFAAGLAQYPTDWESVARLNTTLRDLGQYVASIPVLERYQTSATERRAAVLQFLVQEMVREIASAGSSVSDIEAILDLKERHAARLDTQDAAEQAEPLNKAAAIRIGQLVNEGLNNFKLSLAALPLEEASLDELATAIDEYAELAQSVPEFLAYSDAASERHAEIEAAICDAASRSASLDNWSSGVAVSKANTPSTLREVVCLLSRSGRSVTKVTGGWLSTFGREVSVAFADPDTGYSVLALAPSPEAQPPGAYVGIRLSVGTEEQSLTLDDWNAFIDGLTQPSISGEPDAMGRTQCDLLTAHPDDPGKKADGVMAEDIVAEQAVEACLAAVEFDIGNPRLKFQLGRALEAAGSLDDAKPYYEAAAAQNYGAADAALGDLLSLDEAAKDQTIAHYERSASNGFYAARDMVEAMKAPPMNDFNSGWPRSGTVTITCDSFVEVHSPQGELLWDGQTGEFQLTLDVENRKVRVSTALTARSKDLLVASRDYSADFNGNTWTITTEPYQHRGQSGSLTLDLIRSNDEPPVKLQHNGDSYVGSIGSIDIENMLTVTGGCF